MKIFFTLPVVLLILFSCNKNGNAVATYTNAYTIAGNKIYNYNKIVQLIGVNAFHTYSTGGSDMESWNIDIAREFVGNVEEQPTSGQAIKDSTGAYLYSLQKVVDSNRADGLITILCPFGWNGLNSTLFTGTRPTQTYWWNNFKLKLRQWAIQFKDQPDVWIEVWNEPYRYDRTDGYTDDTWVSDMNELVNVIRSAGNENIILVPCAEQGQDESVLNNKGVDFLAGKSNILFDIHAYEKWLMAPGADIGNRLQQLQQNNIPIIFGETAPLNAGVLMNPKPFLDSVYNRGLSVCAWVWKYDGTDTDALLDSSGLPNNNANNNWGSNFRELSLSARNP